MQLPILVKSLSFTHMGQGHHNHTPKSYKNLMIIVTGMRLPDIKTAVREAMVVARKTLEEKGLSSISVILIILQDKLSKLGHACITSWSICPNLI